MELSSEDALRLHVLLANPLYALRIHEPSMTLWALSARGELKIRLTPTGRPDAYLKCVKELLSGHVLGSPGGYPVYLQRWTRMGQARDERLAQLLLLGEPEAVVAVVHAAGLTPTLAEYAWWALPDAANACKMLENPAIASCALGPRLAAYLIEHLPFEEDAWQQADTVRLLLQPGLIEETTRLALWRKGAQQSGYWLGFLWGSPEALPEPLPARLDAVSIQADLAALPDTPALILLRWTLSSAGQSFLHLAEKLLNKAANQELVNQTLTLLAQRFAPLRPPQYTLEEDLNALLHTATCCCDTERASVPGLADLLAKRPDLQPQLRAMLLLSGLSYAVVRPVFAHSTAVGALMRRKLAPLLAPLLAELARLQQPVS